MKAMSCLACNNEVLCAIADALATDNMDQALEFGLLDHCPETIDGSCGECDTRARTMIAARDAHMRALAARERYRAREARLTARAEARARKRAPAAPHTSTTSPSLPPAAAAALARAKARVAVKQQPE